MLRRTFFKLLAALPFVPKTSGSLHYSHPSKPEDWSAVDSAAWIQTVPYRGYPPTLREIQTWCRRYPYALTNIKVSK